ncbi:MAG: hypothetical protein IKN47_06510 [Lachnospiraceae bacterium]|nr:hypothetical protein [Lachnospiraceae bacterium]
MKKRTLDLQRFADGTDGAAAEGVTSGDAGQDGRKKGDLSNVIYGKQDDAADDAGDDPDNDETDGSDGVDASEEDQESFEDLIKGKFKDDFHKKVKGIINSRFAQTKGLEEQLNSYAPVLDALRNKYGLGRDADPEAIMSALDEDSSFYEDEALERGMSVEDLKSIKKIERENARLKEQMNAANTQREADRIYQGWLAQEAELKEIYPDFDFRTEAENEEFTSLIKNGINLRTAYEVVHKDEIITGAMAMTAKKVKEQVTQSIAKNGKRPLENGINAGSGKVVKSDVEKLTKADRDEIEKRVMRGEKIVF